jgi:hypothetical protein
MASTAAAAMLQPKRRSVREAATIARLRHVIRQSLPAGNHGQHQVMPLRHDVDEYRQHVRPIASNRASQMIR